MKSITERPPILTIHEDSGDYILRVGDLKYRSLVAGVSKLLPEARRLIVVTPGDVKFFVMGDGDGSENSNNRDSDLPAGDSDHAADNVEEAASEDVGSQLPQPEESPIADEPLKRTRRRKPLRDDVRVGHTESCQRCGGKGTTRTLMPDNSTAESMCPICQGEGTIKRYGARR